MFEMIVQECLENKQDSTLASIAEVAPALRMLKNGRKDHAFVLSFEAGTHMAEGALSVKKGEDVVAAYEAAASAGVEPGVVLTQDAGAFALGASMEAAVAARDAFLAGRPVPACAGTAGESPSPAK